VLLAVSYSSGSSLPTGCFSGLGGLPLRAAGVLGGAAIVASGGCYRMNLVVLTGVCLG